MPLISIIIPVYNAETYLPKLFDCLKKQAFKDFEVILVINGSTDGSEKLANEFKATSNLNVSIIALEKNIGPSGARNVGIEHSRGEFLTFIDSDDYVSEHHLSNLLTAIGHGEYDLGITLYKKTGVYWRKGRCIRIKNARSANAKGFGSVVEFCKKNTKHRLIRFFDIPGYVWNKIYKRELIEKFKIRFEGDHNEDHPFNALYCSKIKSVGFSSSMTYFYVQRRNSLSNPVDSSEKNSQFVAMLETHEYALSLEDKNSDGYANLAGYSFVFLLFQFPIKTKNSETIAKYSSFLNQTYESFTKAYKRTWFKPFISIFYGFYKLLAKKYNRSIPN